MKVEQFYSKNQFRLYGERKDIFQSYDSKVVVIDWKTNTITFGRDWDYSTTTSKYVYLFLEDYANISFNGVSNKRAYVNKLIENGNYNNYVIKYDDEMW